MKRFLTIAVVLMAIPTVGQQSAPADQGQQQSFATNLKTVPNSPTYSDMYCSGFVSKEKFDMGNAVLGADTSPNQTLYGGDNLLLLTGSGYQEGQRYTVIRALQDPNRREAYKGQHSDMDASGQAYAPMGRVRVVALRGEAAVAVVEFSCQGIATGDSLIPFQEKPEVTFRNTPQMNRFPNDQGKLQARIIMSNEFDFLVGRGQKVFINAGSEKGVKVGDYFRAVRGYDPDKIDPVEALSYNAPVADDTQKFPGKVSASLAKKLPLRALGELIVLSVTPTSSTAMITNSLESIEVGDRVELESEQ